MRELACDENEKLGVLNYLFTDFKNLEHIDAVSYLNQQDSLRPYYYTISNIKKC